MSEPFFGEIRMCAFNFPPKGWATCDGQLLAISQNQALFSLLGTTYGGNGQTTFGLPDMRGRSPIHFGSANPLGQSAGAESVALAQSQLPTHAHGVRASSDLAATTNPAGGLMGAKGRGGADVYAPATNLTPLAPAAVGTAGGGQAHDNMQPSLVVSFVIALQGIFPSRN